jgi:uncharacterized membrane protein
MKRFTLVFIVASILIIAIYDIYALTQGGAESTISSVLITLSHQYLIVPFLFGIPVGHLFWRMDSNKDVK